MIDEVESRSEERAGRNVTGRSNSVRTCESHDQAPKDNNDRKPDLCTDLLEDQITGDLEETVQRKEDGKGSSILAVGETKLLLHTGDTGIADSSSVEEGEKVEDRADGQDAPVHLADDTASLAVIWGRGRAHVRGSAAGEDGANVDAIFEAKVVLLLDGSRVRAGHDGLVCMRDREAG